MCSCLYYQPFLSRVGLVCLWTLWVGVIAATAAGHEGLAHALKNHKHSGQELESDGEGKEEANHYFRLFTSLVEKWPLPCRDELVAQSTLEHQFIHGDPFAPDLKKLRLRRRRVLDQLTALISTYRIELRDGKPKLDDNLKPITVCHGMPSLILIRCVNSTDTPRIVRAATPYDDPVNALPTKIPSMSQVVISYSVLLGEATSSPDETQFELEFENGQNRNSLSLPLEVVEPARIRLQLIEGDGPEPDKDVTGRITVQCSDGVCRHGGKYAANSTFTDKPIIYPPIGTWQKLPFFYSDQVVEMEVPPGATRITFERGFEHRRAHVDLSPTSGETVDVVRSCERILDMPARGWYSGDTHVHWVTNAWNVDEPLELLSMAQRAEDLRVANNLTLLQRYANQAFVKPSQAPMGPVLEHSDSHFHVQMGEEYRNEDFYGHLCFLNIDWLVQPIGTGSIIAGPDALDYPINRTAIEACRIQGGISIEAHGTGGNKDVPINVIHRLADSLDQVEPEMYYRLLDCGFQLPLTNGSDHPARTLGIARAYVQVQGEFSFDRWIEGIRNGRTFTTSGPLLFLEVNGQSIGDVLFIDDPTEVLSIKAKVVSRDPIGTIEIVSNGKVLFSHDTDDTQFETEIMVSAEESRWIIARCSSRTDGRAEFGFGNFNAITGPGIAHTSPIYVQVNGMPRFDPMAADFWRERMRVHANDIRGRGRFADQLQRAEAVGYIEQGMEMFQDLKQQVKLARSRNETFEEARRRLTNVVRRIGISDSASRVLDNIEGTTSFDELKHVLSRLTFASLLVDRESKLNVEAVTKRIELMQGRPQRFLVAIENRAGITGPIRFDVLDGKTGKVAEWCRTEVVHSPFTSAFLTGAPVEFKVVELVALAPGQHEIKLLALVSNRSEITQTSTTGLFEVNVAKRGRISGLGK